MAKLTTDWRVLRGAAGLCVLCALLAAGMLIASNMFWQQMNSDYRTHYARFRDASRKYLSVDGDERVIAERYPRFVELYARGVIGDEHRLSWIETLRRVSQRIGLPSLDYKLDAQRLYTPPNPLDSGPFDIRVSEMHLTLGLLHEGDLVRFVSDLEHDAEGLFHLERCDFTRAETRPETAASGAARLTAACVLKWYTLTSRGDRKITL
ncbi:MAG: hypothetical protein HYX63_13155 [Gammaproteobacteria bacterium]|nr:hypothetical protein [Gammaproteobacteria bacterium]